MGPPVEYTYEVTGEYVKDFAVGYTHDKGVVESAMPLSWSKTVSVTQHPQLQIWGWAFQDEGSDYGKKTTISCAVKKEGEVVYTHTTKPGTHRIFNCPRGPGEPEEQ